MADFAEITYQGKTYKYPVTTGTENENGVDISTLLSDSNLITLDVGFKNTGSTQSKITFIDGDAGKLYYRGYAIEQLAEQSTFMEVSYLLIYGELPTAEQLKSFEYEITMHTLVHENVKKFLNAYPSDTHPMGVMMSVVTALSSFYPSSLNPNKTPEEVNRNVLRLMAKMPTIAAWTYKKSLGHPYMYPNNRLDYMSNFASMFFGVRSQAYEPDPVVVDALDKLFILHADHEQNCSTSTVRMVGSAHTNLYASVGAGIAALWGPRHGGANQSVIEMLEEIKATGGNVQKYVDMVKDKNQSSRLMGFGHRVYKNFDPRAQIIKKSCDAILEKLGVNDEILEIAKALEEVALKDDYFISRKLYPNVDFYSGIIYRAIGIPTEMFTVMFAMGRLPGWIAQWKEMRTNNEPIGRPRQIYTGTPLRDYVPIVSR